MNRKEAIKLLSIAGISMFLPFELFNAENSPKNNLKIHLIGLGSAGQHVLAFLKKQNIKAKYTAIDRQNFSKNSDIDFIQIAGKESKKELQQIFNSLINKNEKAVFIAGLSAKTGSKLIENFAHFSSKNKINFNLISILPFRFEGEKRKQKAEKTLKNLSKYKSYIVNNENLRHKYGNVTVRQAFELSNSEVKAVLEKL